jgi:hypothetical protein
MASVNQGATPAATVAGNAATVSWAASTLSTGTPVTGYIVRRYDAGNLALQTIGAACSGTLTATSCIESAIPAGSWVYSVTPVFASNWQGAESATSNAVDRDAPVVTGVSSPLANGDYGIGRLVPVRVTFSKTVTVTGTPQLTLATGAPATTAISYASGSGTTVLTFNYTVVAGNTSGALDYAAPTSLSLNGGTIRDSATRNATLTLATPATAGSLGVNKALVIDTTAPTLASVVATNITTLGAIAINDRLTFTYTDTRGVAASSIVAGWNGTGSKTVSVAFTNNSSADSLTVPGIGNVALGGDWLSQTTLKNETLSMSASGVFVLTISTVPGGARAGVIASTFTWTATGGSASDAAGNLATGSIATVSQRF